MYAAPCQAPCSVVLLTGVRRQDGWIPRLRKPAGLDSGNKFNRSEFRKLAKNKNQMTLDRVLSRFGLSSRSLAEEAIRSGRVKVNGRVVADPGFWTDIDTDAIHLDGKRIRQSKRIYLLFYKPKGVITSHGDPQGRKTIYDCLDSKLPWLSPVGRLDKDTSGLILLTNDTDFLNHVSDPASGIQKTYLVKANGLVGDERIAALTLGYALKNGRRARPQSVRRIGDKGKYSRLEIILTEGKNREVHRLLESVGLKVLKLVRTRIGPCTMEGLQVGQWRHLLKSELSLFHAPRKKNSPRGKTATRITRKR
jgi:23S rRNA pseudouridine2605 synthase